MRAIILPSLDAAFEKFSQLANEPRGTEEYIVRAELQLRRGHYRKFEIVAVTAGGDALRYLWVGSEALLTGPPPTDIEE